MRLSRGSRIGLRIATSLVLAFIYIPILVIVIYAFNANKTQRWPLNGLTLDWFDKAFHNDGVRQALWTSLQAAIGATLIAVFLGTLAAMAVSRFEFFGKGAIS